MTNPTCAGRLHTSFRRVACVLHRARRCADRRAAQAPELASGRFQLALQSLAAFVCGQAQARGYAMAHNSTSRPPASGAHMHARLSTHSPANAVPLNPRIAQVAHSWRRRWPQLPALLAVSLTTPRDSTLLQCAVLWCRRGLSMTVQVAGPRLKPGEGPFRSACRRSATYTVLVQSSRGTPEANGWQLCTRADARGDTLAKKRLTCMRYATRNGHLAERTCHRFGEFGPSGT